MTSVLDHLLLGCDDLARGVAFVEASTGIRASAGGVHPGRGTRNALASLGRGRGRGRGSGRYLEIIAPDPAQDALTWHPALRSMSQPRLVGWAARCSDIDTLARRLRDAGVSFTGPTPGSRRRPDGRTLQWQTLTLNDDGNGLLPFFIQWSADTIHPSVDSPTGLALERFSLITPDRGALETTTTLLELDVEIEIGDTRQTVARIAAAGGSIEVRS